MAQSAAAPLKHSSWPSWFFSRPTTAAIAAHRSSPFTTKPHIPLPLPHDPPRRRRFSASLLTTTSRLSPLDDDADPDPLDDADPDSKKSRNELKREARRAFRWGLELANFSTPQIKCVLRAASLEGEVLDALMLVKRLGPDVREGKRRQFNYIGRLLRTAEPELMDALIQASKDGDSDRLLALSGKETWSVKDDDVEEETDYEEGYENCIQIAARWFDGLIYKESSIINEVYAIHNVEFDRQELRKLVRRVQSIQEGSPDEESGEPTNGMFNRAKKPLIRFLRDLAKKSLED